MKLDTNTIIKEIDGTPMPDKDGPVTLKAVCANALLFNGRDELTGEEKLGRYRLARRIYDASGIVEITIEEAAKLKDVIGKYCVPVVAGQVMELIEQSA
ncbi:hypothetical protein [Burkholderia cenocepacia]|uniref:hypothetical protein n=1 Tax=Burkholderia cenocepacia TaxID=95486 RepID=UPI001CF342F6|nr:hypothetical protein [Burkholderia cenocepacia]MCA8237772.1 hypothetical protein [Burkholderia cenocepacia]